MNNKFINIFLPISLFVVVMSAMASFFVEIYIMNKVTGFAWYSASIGFVVAVIFKVIHNCLIQCDNLVNVDFLEEFTKK